MGGMGGNTTGMGGSGGAGGAGAGGAGGTGSGGAGGAGGSPTGTILLMAGGGADIFTAERTAGSAWVTSSLADATAHAPAITMTDASSAVALIRSTSNAGELRFATWGAGAWSGFSGVAQGVTTRATPSLDAAGGIAHALFHGDNFKHYYASYTASWSPSADPVGGVAAQSFGPSPGALVALPTETVVAYAGNDHDLYAQSRMAGAWAPAVGFNLGDMVLQTPAAVALSSGPELMVVFVRKTDMLLAWTTRSAGVWSAPATIAQTSTNDPPSLCALPGGGAVLAFRGQNGQVFTSIYTPGAPSWSAPSALAAITTPAPPAVARGIDGADAELAFIDSAGGEVLHARLMAGAWSVPELVGGSGNTSIAMTSSE